MARETGMHVLFGQRAAVSSGQSYLKKARHLHSVLCSRDVSVAYGGMKDLKKHELTSVHQSASRSVKSASALTAYFSNLPGPKREQAVVEAEVKFGYFIGEHHLALALADHK